MTVPQEGQLLFIGSTKKSYDQLKGWYELCKKNPAIINRTQILVLPIFEGFLSRKGVRNAVQLFLKTAVPKGHKGRVIPIYEEASEYQAFSKFLDTKHNLSVVLLGSGSEPLWRTSGEVTDEKVVRLQEILDS